ncbi:MAG: hypothetical protein HY819_12795 [Acidobacteria bacterium]|nr:hypothetical protein [Acidobacteriota bacterium]
MKIASNTIANNLDNFSPQSNNPVNSTANTQPSIVVLELLVLLFNRFYES